MLTVQIYHIKHAMVHKQQTNENTFVATCLANRTKTQLKMLQTQNITKARNYN